MANDPTNLRFVFFGTPRFAKIVLDELERAGYVPALVVTAPDKPQGRKLVVTPCEVKVWALKRNIPVLTPERLRDEAFLAELTKANGELLIVAAYGKIIPKIVLDMPRHGVLNVHPSLLPKFRGPSPIESAILSDETSTGVTIIALDEETDHGPIVAQRHYQDKGMQSKSTRSGLEAVSPKARPWALKLFPQGRTLNELAGDWPPKGSELAEDLARLGGVLLAEVIPEWVAQHHAHPQDHARATFTKKVIKGDGLIDLSGDPLTNYKKIRAYDEWPGAYFFTERNGKLLRVRIADATYNAGKLTITRVVPEGKKEMSYEDFLRGVKPM